MKNQKKSKGSSFFRAKGKTTLSKEVEEVLEMASSRARNTGRGDGSALITRPFAVLHGLSFKRT